MYVLLGLAVVVTLVASLLPGAGVLDYPLLLLASMAALVVGLARFALLLVRRHLDRENVRS